MPAGTDSPYVINEIKPHSFIYEIKNALPVSMCEEMVTLFENSEDKQYEGRIGQGQVEEQSIKKSTDLRISGNKEWEKFDTNLFQSLSKALNQFSAEFPFFAVNKFKDMGYNMQRTRVGEYYHWHIDSGPDEFSQRQLVAIWYLNDVDGPGGETEFALQDIKIKPETGKMVLFAPFWTHIHRNVTLEAGVKYIATTWVCFT